VYVPAYFAEFTRSKANDLDGFLAGTAAYVRARDSGSGVSPRIGGGAPPG